MIETTVLMACECCVGKGRLYRDTSYGELNRYDCTACDGTGMVEALWSDGELKDDEDE